MLKLPYKLYRNKFYIPSLPPANSLSGQTILITGGNTGLGFALALHCLNLNASLVIITTRTTAKGLAAKAQLETQTTGTGKVQVMLLDMSTLGAVKEFADQVTREVKVIDVVYLNAGVQNFPGYAPTVSKDGWEETLQVNAWSTVLLGLLLLPWLKVAGRGKARLSFTGSGMHRNVDISPEAGWPQQDVLPYWKEAEHYKKVGGIAMYQISKLFMEYGKQEIAKLALGTDGRPEVIVTSSCPGPTKSDLGRQAMSNPVLEVIGKGLLTIFMKSTSNGAITLVHAAVKGPEEHGEFYNFYETREENHATAEKTIFGTKAQKMQKQVWGEMVVLMTEKVPEVTEIVRGRR